MCQNVRNKEKLCHFGIIFYSIFARKTPMQQNATICCMRCNTLNHFSQAFPCNTSSIKGDIILISSNLGCLEDPWR